MLVPFARVGLPLGHVSSHLCGLACEFSPASSFSRLLVSPLPPPRFQFPHLSPTLPRSWALNCCLAQRCLGEGCVSERSLCQWAALGLGEWALGSS